MADCKYLLLVCLNFLLAGGDLTMEGISMTNHEGYRISPPGVRMEKMTKEVQTLAPSTTIKPGSSSWMDSEALSELLVGIIRAELSQCILAIVWDSFLDGSTLIDALSQLPNVKQVVGSGDIDRLMWGAKQCTAYIFLLVDPSSLMDQAEYAKHDAWDYSGRMITVGLSRSQMDMLTRTKKGRKTEHILGIVQNNAGHFVVLMNQLYKNDRISHMLIRRTAVSTSQNYSKYLNILPKKVFNLQTQGLKQTTTTQSFAKLFPDKTKNLHGFTLIVVCFPVPPAIIYRYDERGNIVRYGDNVRVVETMAEIFNFTPHFMEPPAGSLWGYQLPNGTWTGLVGMFERGDGDLGIANLYISDLGGRNQHQQYTAPFGQEIMCFMIKKGTSTPRWQSLALPFKKDTWTAVIVMVFLLGPIFFALSRSNVIRDENLSKQSMAFMNLYTLGVHLKVAQTQLPVSLSLQIFVAFLWVYVIIVLEAYSAKLVSFLTVERIPEGINTIEDLYHASLPIYGNTRWYYDSFALAKNEYIKKLTERYSIQRDFEDSYIHLMTGQAAYIASANNLMYTISLYAKNGNPTLRLLKECFQPYNTALGVQSHSPLKRNLDQAVNWVREAGLPYQWRRETMMIVRQEKRTSPTDSTNAPDSEGEKRVSFSLAHLEGVFIMYGVGSGLSLLAFACELPFTRVT